MDKPFFCDSLRNCQTETLKDENIFKEDISNMFFKTEPDPKGFVSRLLRSSISKVAYFLSCFVLILIYID